VLVEVEHKGAEFEIRDAITIRSFYGILLKRVLVICALSILNGRKL
jgi:hypothetical protein